MDPDEALAQIRRDYQYFSRPRDEKQIEAVLDHIDSLVEHVIALDSWLSKGGFLPHSWDPAQHESIRLYPNERPR